jgi:hypothetical protein
MTKITKIRGIDSDELAQEIKSALENDGYTARVSSPTSTSVNIQNVRLGNKAIERRGYNISPYTGRKGRVIGWKDWVEVNDTINDVMDRKNASGNVRSLNGKFVIREGKQRKTERDWSSIGGENVGSQMNPVSREEAWSSENVPRVKKNNKFVAAHKNKRRQLSEIS